MGDRENRGAVERFWAALEKAEFDAAGEELHEDFTETYFQSGERLPSKEKFLAMVRSFPGFPAVKVRRHIGAGDVWVTEASFDYARDGSKLWEGCEVQELQDGKIREIHAFFGAPFDAADWRAPFVERI